MKRPPPFIQSVIGALLPPARREEVLGDLEEEYRLAPHHRALWTYLVEAAALLPSIFYRQWRDFSAGPGVPRPLPTGLGIDALRRRVEEFEQENHSRLLFYVTMVTLLSLLIASLMSLATWWFPRVFGSGFILLLLYTAWQHQSRGSGRPVPAGASVADLVSFYKQELARRRDFLQTLWYWKMVPMGSPILVALLIKRDWDTASTAIWTVAFLALAYRAARRQASGIQKRIDELNEAELG